MKFSELIPGMNLGELSKEMHQFMTELFPLCRSITGEDLRETLRLLKLRIPLELNEVPTGTKVFDWTIPKEWNIRDAFVKNSKGERVIDFQKNNLHILNYSTPAQRTIGLFELKEHLFSLPDHPDWIPYRTSYYKEKWGFCISHNQLLNLPEDDYEVFIDATLEEGSLTYGELYLPGEISDEILISTHVCHPSLCNDNLSGVVLTTFLAELLGSLSLRFSYRFLFIPATIGAITWLALNENRVANIKHGLVVACVGDPGKMTYKKSKQGDAKIDKAAIHVLRHSDQDYEVMEFSPYGYDERQFNSPGFNLPVGSLMRSPNGRYPEYHTSADDLEFVRPECLTESLRRYLQILNILENDGKYINEYPYGEPHLGKYGLYRSIGGPDLETDLLAMLWVLNLSDGQHSLLDIAERSGIHFDWILNAKDALLAQGLIELIEE